MPYRRLPNTDAARVKALTKAYEKAKALPPFQLAFSQSSYQRIQSFLPSFETALYESRIAYKNQTDRSAEYNRNLKKAKLYISHFIQVFNMAIQRGEIKDEEREFFGLSSDITRIPKLHSESEVIKWGEKLIHGEEVRKSKGSTAVTNPTIAVVKVRYEQFLELMKHQKVLQRNYKRALERVDGFRAEADAIIQQTWNEVEEKFNNLPPDEKRREAMKYGVVYVFRKSELTS